MSESPRSASPATNWLLRLAYRCWPELQGMQLERMAVGAGDVITVLYSAPFILLGLALLGLRTDLQLMQAEWLELALMGGLLVLFNQFKYFLIARIRPTRFGSTEGSLEGVILWSGLFLYGPSALWIWLLWALYEFYSAWRLADSKSARWRVLRSGALDFSAGLVAPLLSLELLVYLGGNSPIAGLTAVWIGRGMAALAANFALTAALLLGYLMYHAWAQRGLLGIRDTQAMVRFFLLGMVLPQLANPFGILGAGLQIEHGPPAFLFFISGMLAVGVLTRQLSWAAELSRQQAQVLRELELLGNAIINQAPEEDQLPTLLERHLPLMFPPGRLILWTFPDTPMYRNPPEWDLDLPAIWPWLASQTEARGLLPGDQLPWAVDQQAADPTVIAPILEVETQQPVGGCYLSLYTLSQPWTRRSIDNIIPGVQSLATVIASALNQALAYQRRLELQRVSQELRLAGNIQSSFLPYSIPRIPGWQLAVTLQPARETSGDFFDIIPLPGGDVGIVIADVVDKGVGAALYMAISRTLIRTYILETNAQPELVFFAVNQRILMDTSSNLFVTVFYGLLETETGTLTYSNAGHNPPYLVRQRDNILVQELIRTGLPIGVELESTWQQSSVHLQPGDCLILYTDGIPEARNSSEAFFGTQAILEAAKQNLGRSAEAIQQAILQDLHSFVGDAPQLDDITLMVLARDAAG